VSSLERYRSTMADTWQQRLKLRKESCRCDRLVPARRAASEAHRSVPARTTGRRCRPWHPASSVAACRTPSRASHRPPAV